MFRDSSRPSAGATLHNGTLNALDDEHMRSMMACRGDLAIYSRVAPASPRSGASALDDTHAHQSGGQRPPQESAAAAAAF